MKARLNQWAFQALSFGLAVLFRVAYLMPEPQPEGRHRSSERATRASDRQVRQQRDEAANRRRVFAELKRDKPPVLLGRTVFWDWDSNVGLAWMDEFDIPPLPQRRFRALAPRALAADAAQARQKHRQQVL